MRYQKAIVILISLIFLLVCGCGKEYNKKVLKGTVIKIGTVKNLGGGFLTPSQYEVAITVKLTDGRIFYGTTPFVVSVGKTVYTYYWEDKNGRAWITYFTPYRP